jgi:hypothetical protein
MQLLSAYDSYAPAHFQYPTSGEVSDRPNVLQNVLQLVFGLRFLNAHVSAVLNCGQAALVSGSRSSPASTPTNTLHVC